MSRKNAQQRKNAAIYFFGSLVALIIFYYSNSMYGNSEEARRQNAAQLKADGLCITNISLPCVFPFSFEGETYTTCAQVTTTEAWCATSVDSSGKLAAPFFAWGYCDTETCPTELNPENNKYKGGAENKLCPECTLAPTMSPTTRPPKSQSWQGITSQKDKIIEGPIKVVVDKSKCVTKSGSKCIFPQKFAGSEINGCVDSRCNVGTDDEPHWQDCDMSVCPDVCVDWGCTCRGLTNCLQISHRESWGKAGEIEKKWWMSNGCKTKKNDNMNCEETKKKLMIPEQV